MKCDAHNPLEGPNGLLNPIPDGLLACASSDIQVDVVDMRDGHPDSIPVNAPVLCYGRNNCTTGSIFSKAEWIWVSGIGEPLVVSWAMIVAEESVIDSCCSNLFSIEWGVRSLALTLLSKPAPLRSMEQSQVNSAPIHLETV